MALSRVLLAEDDSFLAQLIRQTLADADLQVFIARNGEEAIMMADGAMPDLFVLDVHMPRMTGIEALKVLRAQSAHRMIPVMMLTAARDEVSVRAALEAGATDFLAKPFQPDVLLKRVMRHLSRETPCASTAYLQI